MSDRKPVIVGAGPAGISAAVTLVAAGLTPIVLDEAPRSGGQIYRRPPPGFTRSRQALYGFEAAKARRLHEAFDALAGRIDYRPETLVWDMRGGALHCLSDGRSSEIAYRDLILATGARDRIIPFPGWTLPGIYTLGGAQIALKYQGCAIGRNIVFLGTGPLLYLVAYQYAKAGATVLAVLDTAPFAAKRRGLPGLLKGATTFAKGLWYLASLRARGIRLESGVGPIVAEGDTSVSALRYRAADGVEHRIACDGLAFGFGLSSETQLADLAEIPFRYDAVQQQFLPAREVSGRTPVAGIYLAGDGGGIAGADAAELSGERAALALLEDRGQAVDKPHLAAIERTLQRIAGFRAALETAFPFPADFAAAMADETILCRCEGVTAGEFRRAAAELGAAEVNRAKAFTRCGMGRCQGRVCGPAAAIVLAAALAVPPERIGRLRGQAPVKPIPLAVTA
ncbi:MAG TPA: NAD(P)/FAD-dependent oxidoreductase [Stellaceae bacterium]|nr:NAD(P)/FAD-dependent oxidoreductase [Stellaceae bacterium]